MKRSKQIREAINFLDRSPTPYHAVAQMEAMLVEAGFSLLSEEHSLKDLKPGRYFIKRDGAALVAFRLEGDITRGFKMVGAHTDSPCLVAKPAGIYGEKYRQLGVEIYGGLILSSWLDRDLSLAGVVTVADTKGQLKTHLLDFRRPIALLPNAAIHLNRGVNENRTINQQKEMVPILATTESKTLEELVLAELKQQGGTAEAQALLGFDLRFYESQPAQLTGLRQEFLSAGRLDNLASCFSAIYALCQGAECGNQLVACYDHEEVGSGSHRGAAGPLLRDLLMRLCGSDMDRFGQMVANSFLISADNAHALHPNYTEFHEPHHLPLMNGGVVLKINNSYRYSTTPQSAAIWRQLCRAAEVPCQLFVSRSDKPCGSTIGPIATENLGVRSVDVGLPSWAMHSIREVVGSEDLAQLIHLLTHFFSHPLPQLD